MGAAPVDSNGKPLRRSRYDGNMGIGGGRAGAAPGRDEGFETLTMGKTRAKYETMEAERLEEERRKAEQNALPPPPDLADELIRKAGLAQRNRQLSARGRAASFLTQPVAPMKTVLGG
jgi:hypothetical protein